MFGQQAKSFEPLQSEICPTIKRVGKPGKPRIHQYTVAVLLDRSRQFVERTSTADPFVQMSGSPIIGCDRVRPTVIAPVQMGKIRAPERAVLHLVEAVATPRIGGRRGGDLHWSLWSVKLRAPHF